MEPSLNPEQQRAVATVTRPVLVMAPVGTGKTRVLTLRAAEAIAQGVAPESILCLSFTNKAAREVAERLTLGFGKRAAAITTKTFHGLCAGILRSEAATLSIDGDFVIYDEEDTAEIMMRVARRRGIEPDYGDRDKFAFFLISAAEKARLSRYDDPQPRRPGEIFQTLLKTSLFRHGGLEFKTDFTALLRDYVHELRENHALDFCDLIAGVNRLWDECPAALERWRRRYGWVQVDEVQDTSRAEYRILRALAGGAKQLSFFGDIDQTIYEWRGSAPFDVMADYQAEFQPEVIQLTRNYRSTQAILEVCARVIQACPRSVTKEILAQEAVAGDPVIVKQAANPQAEARWIAAQIEQLRPAHRLAWSDCAVLARTNFTARDISRTFEAVGLPHVRVEQQKFFLRAEVKAALAHLRLLENRHDGNSLLRYLKTPPKGIGEATLEKLRAEPRAAGLKLGDLADPATFAHGDPFAPLLDAWREGRVVVFDTETTGLDPSRDEIVELAARRCGAAGAGAPFHAYLRPARAVGASSAVHGYTDEFLAANGRAPAEVLREFEGFAAGCVLAGHNSASFDVPMLASARARCGLSPDVAAPHYDTLDLARRFHKLPRYRLGDLATALKLAAVPSHKAMDDVAATVGLLGRLVEQLAAGAGARRAAVAANAAKFLPLAECLAGWRELAGELRPAELLRRIYEESGLWDYYEEQAQDEKRLDHLTELLRLFERNDPGTAPPRQALNDLLAFAALGNDVERQTGDEDRVPILTVHQAKGLEFDTVFIAHASDDEFPSFRSKRENRLEEEHRLFYTAISRARRRLFLTWPRVNRYGREQMPSRYLDLVAQPEKA